MKKPGPDFAPQALAREQLPKRVRKLGQVSVEIVQEVVSARAGMLDDDRGRKSHERLVADPQTTVYITVHLS